MIQPLFNNLQMQSNNVNNNNNIDRSERIIKRSVDLSIGLLVAILNIIEIILIVRIKRKQKKQFEIILLSLSVADLLYGLSNSAICVVYLGNLKEDTVFDVTYTTYFFFVLTSIFHLVFIAVDRLWAVVHPIKHNVLMTRKKVYIALGAVWSLTILISLTLYLCNEKGHMFQNKYGLEQIVNDTETSNSTTFIVNSLRTVNYKKTTAIKATTTMFPITTIISNIHNGSLRHTMRMTRPSNTTSHATKKPSNPLNKTNLPKFQMKLQQSGKAGYQYFMQSLLSWFIVGADILLVCLYTLIIYRVRASNKDIRLSQKADHSTSKVGLVCIFVAASFVLFTIPYAVSTLVSGIASFWANIILVGNSGLNSVIYFFKNRCEQDAQQDAQKRFRKIMTSTSASLSLPSAGQL